MLGNILRLIRIANEYISVKEVATKAGVSPTYISEIEHGNRTPTLEMLKKFSNVYDIPVSKILLFEEMQKEQNLNNKQILIIILKYYVSKMDNDLENKKTLK